MVPERGVQAVPAALSLLVVGRGVQAVSPRGGAERSQDPKDPFRDDRMLRCEETCDMDRTVGGLEFEYRLLGAEVFSL